MIEPEDHSYNSGIPEEKKLLARQLLMKARLYRFFALAFAFVGFVIFLYLYFQRIEGQLLAAMTDLSTVAIILLPFLPAALLSLLSQKSEKKFFDLIRDQTYIKK